MRFEGTTLLRSQPQIIAIVTTARPRALPTGAPAASVCCCRKRKSIQEDRTCMLKGSTLVAHHQAKRNARCGGIGLPWPGGPARSLMYCATAPKNFGLPSPTTSAAIDCVLEGV